MPESTEAKLPSLKKINNIYNKATFYVNISDAIKRDKLDSAEVYVMATLIRSNYST